MGRPLNSFSFFSPQRHGISSSAALKARQILSISTKDHHRSQIYQRSIQNDEGTQYNFSLQDQLLTYQHHHNQSNKPSFAQHFWTRLTPTTAFLGCHSYHHWSWYNLLRRYSSRSQIRTSKDPPKCDFANMSFLRSTAERLQSIMYILEGRCDPMEQVCAESEECARAVGNFFQVTQDELVK